MAFTDTNISDFDKNLQLDALLMTHVSLHTGDPGTTGANEASGGSYARQAVTFNAASSGVRDSVGIQTFSVNAGTYTYVGLWDALSAGNFYRAKLLSPSIVLSVVGTIDINDIDLTVIAQGET